jgi:hypothetical protein
MMRQTPDKLREFFRLRAAEQKVRSLPLDRQLERRREIERAVATMRDAAQVDDRRTRIELAEKAILQLLAANAIAAGQAREESSDQSERTVFDHARSLSPPPPLQQTLAELERSERAAQGDDSRFGRLARLFAWLETRIETRTLRQIQLLRVLRPVVILALLVAGGWWYWSPSNLARGQYVVASTLCAHTPLQRYGHARLDRVVDGVRYEVPFAVCTLVQPNPWITVDLKQPHTVTEVVVYGRGDCCWGQRDLPLEVQVSADNVKFRTVGKVTEPYTDDFPARVSFADTRARYVRLYNPSRAPKELVINELEVYGY